MRFMEAVGGIGWRASHVIPADLMPATDFSFNNPSYLAQTYNGTAADWPTANPTSTVSREIPIYQTRPYSVTPGPGVSGKVYLQQHFKRSVPSTDYAAYPYEFVPQNNGLDYDWYQPLPFMGVTSITTAVIEFVCGDEFGNPINHNLQSGQIVGLNGFTPVTVSNSNGGGTALSRASCPPCGSRRQTRSSCRVPTTGLPAGPRLAQATTTQIQSGLTAIHSGVAQSGTTTTVTLDSGASTTNNIYQTKILAITSGTGSGQQTQIASYTGSSKLAVLNIPFAVAPDSTSHFSILPNAFAAINNPTAAYPIEAIGGVPSTLNGTAIWIAVPHAMGEAGITAYATRLFNSTPRGTKIYIEYSNEILVPNQQFLWLIGLTAMMFGNGVGVDLVQAAVQRGADVQAIFVNVWGSDSVNLVRVFQPFGLSPAQTQIGLAYAQANSIPIDAIAIAPYVDIDLFSPSMTMAAAAIVANDLDSIANAHSGVVATTMPVLPMAAYHDIARHWLKYQMIYGGPNGLVVQHYDQIAATGYGGGGGSSRYTYPIPKIIFYEANFWTVIPAGVSHSNHIVRSGITHDFMYHPEYYNTTNTYLQFCQQPGPSGTVGADAVCIENLTYRREAALAGAADVFICSDGSPDNGFAAISGVYLYATQQPGFGLDNQFWAVQLGGDGSDSQGLSQPIDQRPSVQRLDNCGV